MNDETPAAPEPWRHGLPDWASDEWISTTWSAACRTYYEHMKNVGSPGHEFVRLVLAAAPTPASREQAEQQDQVHFAANGDEAKSLQPLLDAHRDVLAERQRQINAEGWTTEHDDDHSSGELGAAAACYAVGADDVDVLQYRNGENVWPWNYEWFKPKDHRSNLVRAGALILAEIERLDRVALGNRTPARQEERSSEKEVGAAPLPVQGQGPTEAMVVAAARALCHRNAAEFNADEIDSWRIYGEMYREDARAALVAALRASSAPNQGD